MATVTPVGISIPGVAKISLRGAGLILVALLDFGVLAMAAGVLTSWLQMILLASILL
jgi:hypothetical protein